MWFLRGPNRLLSTWCYVVIQKTTWCLHFYWLALWHAYALGIYGIYFICGIYIKGFSGPPTCLPTSCRGFIYSFFLVRTVQYNTVNWRHLFHILEFMIECQLPVKIQSIVSSCSLDCCYLYYVLVLFVSAFLLRCVYDKLQRVTMRNTVGYSRHGNRTRWRNLVTEKPSSFKI